MRILVVEDDFSSRTLLLRYLEKFGQCDVAVNGVEAIDAFDLARSQKAPYALICLDLNMPELDGISVLKEIRKREEALQIQGRDGVRVVITTGVEGKEILFEAFREGCEAFVRKPIDLREIGKELNALGFQSNSSASR